MHTLVVAFSAFALGTLAGSLITISLARIPGPQLSSHPLGGAGSLSMRIRATARPGVYTVCGGTCILEPLPRYPPSRGETVEAVYTIPPMDADGIGGRR